MTCYICDVCRDKLSTKQSENKIFQRVSSLESSFTCLECSKLFSMAFEVTNRDEISCDTSSKRNYFLISHSFESAIDYPQDCYVTGTCDATETKFTNVSEINSSSVESEILKSDECREYSPTYNVQKNKADGKESSYLCKLSSSIKDSHTYKESDEKAPFENQHVNNIPLKMDEISQKYTSPPTVKIGANLNNQFQTNLISLRNETCNDNIRYKSCFQQPTFKDEDKSSLECNICHLTLKTVVTLKMHMRKHDEANPFICKICKMSCTTRHHLIDHMARHSDERPYKCNSCSSTFKIKAQLSQHMRTHSEKRPFKCHICSSKFKFRNILYRHLRMHSENRPYKCNICPSDFKFKHLLTTHLATHSEKRPYKCNICPLTFKIKAYLSQHMLTHSVKRPFKCNMCSSTFKLKRCLNQHLRMHSEN